MNTSAALYAARILFGGILLSLLFSVCMIQYLVRLNNPARSSRHFFKLPPFSPPFILRRARFRRYSKINVIVRPSNGSGPPANRNKSEPLRRFSPVRFPDIRRRYKISTQNTCKSCSRWSSDPLRYPCSNCICIQLPDYRTDFTVKGLPNIYITPHKPDSMNRFKVTPKLLQCQLQYNFNITSI